MFRLGRTTKTATGLPVIRNKESSLATLCYFLKHKHCDANSVFISSMSLKVLNIFHFWSQMLS